MIIQSILPQELIGEVIDHLGEDFRTLKTSSLVSWAWVSRCRSYLFETCVLTSQNIVPFRDLLLSTECTFSSNIRNIKAFRNSGHLDDHVFDDIATSMRGLRDIRELYIGLRLIRPRDVYALSCMGFITAFPYATRLELDIRASQQASLVNMPLLETISLFPALQELHILDLWQNVSDSPPTRVPPPELNCLELRGASINPILTWLNTSIHLSKVDSLTLSSANNATAPVVRAVMQQLGGALRHLDIELSNREGVYPSPARYYQVSLTLVGSSTADHAAVFDLALHPNLKTLIIHDEPFGLPEAFDPELLFRLVRSLASPALEHLSLELDLLYYEHFDWTALVLFLSGTRFPNLGRVMVKCSSHHEHDDHPYVYGGALAASGVFRTEW
ncbi:hypothetical protein B0H12DRAFT_106898 [Mycena haematopus]|nr:hypothetical protein B0H12DRAFT_106898 [Mycena haematopus]